MSNTGDPARKSIPQFRREDRRELRYQLSVGLAMILSWAFWLIPGPVRGWIADRFGDAFYSLSSTYPRNVLDNVETVLQYTGDVTADRERLVRSIFRTSARNFMDLITIPRQRSSTFKSSVTLVSGSWEYLDRALEEGKGAVLVTGHVGCFDYIGQALVERGYRMTIVTGRTTSRFIFDGVTWLRGSRGLKMVEPTPSGVRNVVKAIRRNEFAVFVTDRDFFQNGHDVVFMGQQTTLPPGPIRIARDTGAPVIAVFTRRVANGHEISIDEPFRVDKTADIKADMAAGMERMVHVLEKGIVPSLDQWAMFQRVWLERQRVPVRVFPVGSPLESELLERVATALPDVDRRLHRKGRAEAPPASSEASASDS